jgi:replicative DNA helicase
MADPMLAIVRDTHDRTLTAVTGTRLRRRADHDLEATVLGECLIDPAAFVTVDSLCTAADFDHPSLAMIFEAMRTVSQRDEPIDVTTVCAELKARGRLNTIGGGLFVAELCDRVASTAHVDTHARTLADIAVTRRMADAAREIEARACDPSVRIEILVEYASTRMEAASRRVTASDPVTLGAAIQESMQGIEDRAAEGALPSVSTGFVTLDNVLTGRGYRNTWLYLLAGLAGAGKTALVQNTCRSVVGEDKGVLFFSLEMPRKDLADRFLCTEARVDNRRYQSNQMSAHEMRNVVQSAERIYQLPLHIDDTSERSPSNIAAIATRYKQQRDIRLIVIDYFQLMRMPQADRRDQAMMQAAYALKNLAKKLDVPIIALAAMKAGEIKRGKRDEPQLEDLRECKALGYAADQVAFLTQDSDNPELVNYLIRKQRGGVSDVTVKMRFDKVHGQFEDLPCVDSPHAQDTRAEEWSGFDAE